MNPLSTEKYSMMAKYNEGKIQSRTRVDQIDQGPADIIVQWMPLLPDLPLSALSTV